MATRRSAKKSELAQAGEHLSAAAGEVGAAVTLRIEEMGDAVSTSMAKVKKKVMAQRDEGKRQISGLVRMAEARFKKAEAEFKKMGERAQKAIAQAEKKLESTKRSTGKKLASLEADAQRKAKALQKGSRPGDVGAEEISDPEQDRGQKGLGEKGPQQVGSEEGCRQARSAEEKGHRLSQGRSRPDSTRPGSATCRSLRRIAASSGLMGSRLEPVAWQDDRRCRPSIPTR